MSELTQTVLRELLHYDPETGVLTWRQRDRKWFPSLNAFAAWNARYAGKPTGQSRRRGYCKVSIFDRSYSIHRIAWLHETGEWPSAEIDHINRDPGDNRWINLRLATRVENMRNAKDRSNKSGFKGVYRNGKRWIAQINLNGRPTHLGRFLTPEGASLMRQWATERYYR
jgi:hypothetical protein